MTMSTVAVSCMSAMLLSMRRLKTLVPSWTTDDVQSLDGFINLLAKVASVWPLSAFDLEPSIVWLSGLVVSVLGVRSQGPGFDSRVTPPLGSNLGQVVYTHCLPSFSAPRNWGTKGSLRHLRGYGDKVR